jgi:uncharacterized protein (TIGR02271 family)
MTARDNYPDPTGGQDDVLAGGDRYGEQELGRTVVGLFRDRAAAEAAIQDLKNAGFSNDQIGVAMQDRTEQKDLAETTETPVAEGAATGALSGGLVGGLIGLLGSLLIPGVGPIVVGGVLGSTLVGAGAGAATGGIIGALAGLGVPEADAQHFDAGLRSGGVLVTVDAGTRTGEALAILERYEADLGPSGSARFRSSEAGLGTADLTTGRELSGARGAATGRDVSDVSDVSGERLELREEELDVTTERVQTGEVRVHKEVVTEQRNVEVPVSREEVVIERRPVAGREASGDLDETDEIRIPVSEEQVRVDKRPVVREEVSVGKREIRDTEEVSETVRREEARIESEGDTGVRLAGSGASRGYEGRERRVRSDGSYTGPERRLAGV